MDLEGKSTEELRNELNLVKGTSVFALGVLLIMLIVGVYGFLSHEHGWVYTSMLITPIIFVNIGPKIIRNMQLIKEELNSRG